MGAFLSWSATTTKGCVVIGPHSRRLAGWPTYGEEVVFGDVKVGRSLAGSSAGFTGIGQVGLCGGDMSLVWYKIATTLRLFLLTGRNRLKS